MVQRTRRTIPTVPRGVAAADRDIANFPRGFDGDLYYWGKSAYLGSTVVHGTLKGAVGACRNEGFDSVYKAVVERQIS